MRWFLPMLAVLLLFGCASTPEEKPAEKPISDDSEVKLIVGENYTLGEPIAIQLKTTNYSISFLNRSGGVLNRLLPFALDMQEDKQRELREH
ncbi:MAG: hypothetical protein ABIF01_00925 [Candidatus Micrarchaeota archaeon]